MLKRPVLIATNPDDIHAASVSLAIRELGGKADLWLLGDLPERSVASIRMDGIDSSGDMKETLRIQHVDGTDALADYGTLWFRRLAWPQIAADSLHPADRGMALNESREHIKALLSRACELAIGVNGYTQAMHAEVKPNQLRAATQAGLRIPQTLISNDPAEIRAFIGARAARDGAIYKPFATPIWQSDRDTVLCYTSLVTVADLPSDAMLRLTPGIFQAYVRKRYELRVVWMDGACIAVKIDSQRLEDARVDWRVAQDGRVRLEKVTLPDEIQRRCTTMMRALSLRFGCIDLIVDDAGDYVFLEVNQMGQFLWIEDINPEIELFDAFVQFIMAPDGFQARYQRFGLSYHEFRDEASARLKRLQQGRERQLNTAPVYDE